MVLAKTVKFLARIIFTLRTRVIILWKCRVIGLFFNASYKLVRTSSELKMAEDFFNIKPWLQSINPDYKFIIKKAHPFSFDRETMLLAY